MRPIFKGEVQMTPVQIVRNGVQQTIPAEVDHDTERQKRLAERRRKAEERRTGGKIV